ncbi:MAG: hypothetical protein ACRD2W_01600 [Acidimicrobiales bacterium]
MTVDYRKLDAALAAALSREPAVGAAGAGPQPLAPPKLSVFVHVDPDASDAQQSKLTRLGLPRGSLQGGIVTANLSPDQVRKLAEQPFVRRIRLSAPLNLLRDDLK